MGGAGRIRLASLIPTPRPNLFFVYLALVAVPVPGSMSPGTPAAVLGRCKHIFYTFFFFIGGKLARLLIHQRKTPHSTEFSVQQYHYARNSTSA